MTQREYWIKSIALDVIVAGAFIAQACTDSTVIMAALVGLCWAVALARIATAAFRREAVGIERPTGFMLYHIAVESVLLFTLLAAGHGITATVYAIAMAVFELGVPRHGKEALA